MKKVNYMLLSTSLSLTLLLTGCATIVGRSRYSLPLDSNPTAARVSVVDEDGSTIFSGVTPTLVSLESGRAFFDRRSYVATFTKPGYKEEVLNLKASIQGWYWGNFAFGGILGFLLIDPLSGCMYKLDESPRIVQLIAGPTIANAEALSLEQAARSSEGAPVITESTPGSEAEPFAMKSEFGSKTKPSAISEQLRELKQLHAEGVLNKSEYETKKRELLKRM